ncbi:LETM1-like protein-domain-containing protein [Lentinula edodes]|uniref:Mitochondrial proton/calcium exchanger protein n=1 Tax=Lentinula lateritia TaxID=40482 RepID=A0A9W9AYC2_9AGAR|nr:LETM1-like protein-domain-containing protein [Lentinula edodes]
MASAADACLSILLSYQPLGSKPSGSTVIVDPHTSAEVKRLPPGTAESAWKKVKHEAAHYWHGSKLLVSEVRISARIQWKILHGEQLTQRERRQLKRTTQDLLRLVPFAVFVIVPFMELLLPVVLKLFPNMLPSTFEDKFAAEEKQRKLFRSGLEMAKFLQETLRESPLKANAHIIGSDAFKAFFLKVRSTGESPSASDIINVARLFDDELTLDNFSRPQLVSMCRYIYLNAFGTDNFLRGALRSRLFTLRRDDQLIDAEGVDSLSTSELQGACQSRGIRTSGVSCSSLGEELSTWISLYLHNRVSGVFLVLGRAFNFDRKTGEDEDGKTNVIKSLESLNEAELEVDSDKASYKQKLEVLQQQEELIEDEEEQEQKEEDARGAKRKAEEREAQTAQALLPDTELVPESVKAEGDDARMTTEQLKELGEALSILSIRSSVLKERSDLRALMDENLHAEEDPNNDSRVGSSLQMISQDAQGHIPVQDLQKALAVIKHRSDDKIGQAVIQKLDVDKDGFVELKHVLGLLQEEGLGAVSEPFRTYRIPIDFVDDDAQTLIGQGREIKNSKPRKEDIVQED